MLLIENKIYTLIAVCLSQRLNVGSLKHQSSTAKFRLRARNDDKTLVTFLRSLASVGERVCLVCGVLVGFKFLIKMSSNFLP